MHHVRVLHHALTRSCASCLPALWSPYPQPGYLVQPSFRAAGGRGGGRGSRASSEVKDDPEARALPLVRVADAYEYAAKVLLRGKYEPGSRLWQVVDWLLGEDGGNCLIILDECHR